MVPDKRPFAKHLRQPAAQPPVEQPGRSAQRANVAPHRHDQGIAAGAAVPAVQVDWQEGGGAGMGARRSAR